MSYSCFQMIDLLLYVDIKMCLIISTYYIFCYILLLKYIETLSSSTTGDLTHKDLQYRYLILEHLD